MIVFIKLHIGDQTAAGGQRPDLVAACHDQEVASAAKACGFNDVFFAKKGDTDGLSKTVIQAVEFAKSMDRAVANGISKKQHA